MYPYPTLYMLLQWEKKVKKKEAVCTLVKHLDSAQASKAVKSSHLPIESTGCTLSKEV